MASLRDKLKAKNAENAAERGNTSSEDTVFADFINRTETKEDIKEPDNNTQEEKNDSAISEEPVIQEKKVAPTKKKAVPKKTTPKKNTTASKEKAADKNKTDEKLPEEENKKSDKETNNDSQPENDKQVTLTISILPELNDYLNIKTAITTTPIKKIFMDIIKAGINAPINAELAVTFRKSQHSGVKRSIQISKSFRELIHKEAIRFKMKPTSFIAYCLTKAYNEDEEYHKAMEEEI